MQSESSIFGNNMEIEGSLLHMYKPFKKCSPLTPHLLEQNCKVGAQKFPFYSKNECALSYYHGCMCLGNFFGGRAIYTTAIVGIKIVQLLELQPRASLPIFQSTGMFR